MSSKSARFAIAALLLSCGAAVAAVQPLELRSGTVMFTDRTPADAAAVLRNLSRTAEHAVVRFTGPVEAGTRSRLAAAGVRLQTYLGGYAYIAAISDADLDAAGLAKIAGLNGAEALQPVWKLHPLIQNGQAPEHAVVGSDAKGSTIFGAYILFHPDADAKRLDAALAKHGVVVRDVLETINGAVIELSVDAVALLAAEEDVLWIEPALPRFSTLNAENRVITQANTAQSAPYNLTGAGVNVLVYDGGTARATHQDFGGRLTVRDSSGLANHATHVSGTIGGSGAASGGAQRGMAPGVTIQSYGFEYSGSGTFLYSNPGDIESDYNQAINVHGVHIANNSIGTNTETNNFPCSIQGDYSVTDALIDNIVRGSLGAPFRVVWAAGNERQGSRCDVEGYGDYYSVAPPGTAKNHIAVGALNANNDTMTSFSSWGPTDDGRLKPDIAAPGCQSGGDGGVTSTSSQSNSAYSVACGTSMAAPTFTGLAALLLQDYRVQFTGQPDPRNSTLKILFAHTAVDLGNPGPDYQFGYGSVRVVDAINFMRAGSFRESEEISQGEFIEYTVNVPAGSPELRATLAWDDAPAAPLAAVALVNDLDIVAIDPSNNIHYPWTLNPTNPGAAAVRTGPNRRDNIEQVLVSSPAPGTWRIRVTGFNVPQGPQPFSIAVTPTMEALPRVIIALPNGVPTSLPPGVASSVPVTITAVAQELVPGSARAWVRYDGGAFMPVELTHVSGNNYTATLPAPTCAANPEFYFVAEGTVSGVVTSPTGGPAAPYAASVGVTVVAVDETFESGPAGWVGGQPGDTATSGQWVLGNPNGNEAQPEDDHTPDPGVNCWFTGNDPPGATQGAQDVDNGFTTLLSPVFDVSGLANPVVSYWRWYTNSTGAAPNADTFLVDISNNGGATWVRAETVGPTGTGPGWNYHQFAVSTILTPTSQMRMRFIAQDTGSGSVVEAALDDFSVTSFECNSSVADCNNNFIADADDIASGRSADVNGNGVPDECEAVCPTVTQQPADAIACAGGQAVFTVAATGTAPLSYQWRRGTALLSGPRYSGVNTPTLTISNVIADDAGDGYHCLVTNACGETASSTASLTVNSTDFDGDGDVGTDADIEAFFACLAGACCPTCGSADFDGDGDVGTDADIEAFFRVLAGGAC
jgi:subtilisin family serine protease